jgi:catechol 2,3-dioxygenase-like lactoylglutathione lyase family enzyme
MKPNSIAGITYYVKDLASTAEFYDALGFRRGKEEPGRVTFYVNWFFVTFIEQDREEDAELHIKVDDVEDLHKGVLANGMKPDGEPQARPSGNREFVLRDPDGYKLAFFQKK